MAAERTTRSWLRAGAILVAPVLAFVALASLPFPVCQSRLFFGVPCPGCGLTRATDALLHLHVLESFRFHPLAIPVLVYIAVELVRAALRELAMPAWPWLESVATARVRVGLAIALIGVFSIRLVGGLGGLPDRVDPQHGLLARGVVWVAESAVSLVR